MNLLRKPGAIVVAALALAVLPSAAEAHDGSHPFVNCTDAYENGYANIPKGDEHYGTHLDRDGDGIGCDNPPAGFEPAPDTAAEQPDNDLAKTGPTDNTPYFAAAGMSVLLAGTALTVAMNRRRANQ
ncbi:excalibur calcium-binding domain-containing protein [Streptomyces sp. NPDC046909]|uniref:excalibur calcium-binding domain-containing protein n=1 Tax=Streptomyces sp. NPDC046909 TaxID=3155617 RepID=UPI0033D12A6D